MQITDLTRDSKDFTVGVFRGLTVAESVRHRLLRPQGPHITETAASGSLWTMLTQVVKAQRSKVTGRGS